MSEKLSWNWRAKLASLAVLCAMYNCAADAAQFLPLRDLTHIEDYHYATGVLDDRKAVFGAINRSLGTQYGYGPLIDDYYGEGFILTPAGGLTLIGDLPGGDRYSGITAMSLDGATAVGFGAVDSGSSEGAFLAVRWTKSEGLQSLGKLPTSSFGSRSFGVSADGKTVVGQSDKRSNFQPFRWRAETGMEVWGEPIVDGRAYDVSADGRMAVGYKGIPSPRGGDEHGVIWTENAPDIDLGLNFPFAISGDGQTVVGITDIHTLSAFVWTQSGGLTVLSNTAGKFTKLGATDVNFDGTVVVGNGNIGYRREAFIWTKADGLSSIHEFAVEKGIDLQGWQLQEASGVSPNGQIIVGQGIDATGKFASWLLDLSIPEPATFHLATGLLSCLIFRQRQSRPAKPL